VDKIHQYKTPALVVVFIAALFLFWHHQHETRKPEYEYKFVKRLYELIERSRHTGTPVQPDELLTILRSAFARTGIRRVSVHLPDREETLLSIKPEHVVPPEEDPRYFIKLPLKRGADGKLSGEGVAGAVYVDNIPRYMPRLSFPNWERGISFRHCVRVAYRKDRKKGRVRRVWDAIVTRLGRKPKELEPDFVNDGFNLRAFKESEKGTRLYNSALSVPLKSVTSGRCVGVLNFDFESTSTLDKSDIAMAVVFGLLCGDVIEK
jgi:hypothetical protein